MASKPIPVGPFLGVNSRLGDTELRTKEGDWLRQAVNLDLTRAGKLKLRPGTTQAIAGTAAHSLHGDGRAPACYVDGTTLYRLRTGPDALSRQAIRADLTPGKRVSYARIGDVLYYSNGIERGMVGPSTAASNWGTLPDLTDPESSAYLCRPTPAGRIVREHLSRLLCARGPTLYYSEPYTPNIYRPAKGYIPFLADISIVAPVATGVFVVADQTYWLPGDISKTSPAAILPLGAAMYSDCAVRMGEHLGWIWVSPRGLMRASPDGTVKALQEDSVAPGFGALGATLLREADGLKKAISSVSNASASGAAARSFMSAEVIRKGVTT